MTEKKPLRFLRARQVIERLGISKTTLWRLVRGGEFPRPLKVSKFAVAWTETEVDAYMLKIIRRRDADAASSKTRS